MPAEAATAVLHIDLAAVVANWRLLCGRHPGGAVGAVVKANGYGLGARPIAAALYQAGCRHVFTATLAEALAIRDLAPDAMLAALSGPVPGSERDYFAHGIVPVLGTLAEIHACAVLARAAGHALPVILHVDTGMCRLGLDPVSVARLHEEPSLLDGLRVSHVMSHLAAAEVPDDPQNQLQLARFIDARSRLPKASGSLANSSGIFLGNAFGSDLARPGAALYGINPTPGQPNPMQPVVRLAARVLAVRDIAAGTAVGYNSIWRAARPSRIATVGIGYADGWHRTLSNRSYACFDGTRVPLVGRVSMDLTTFDVTDCQPIQPNDWLDLLHPGQSPDDIADQAGTNGYEVLTSLGARLLRTYHPA